MVNYPKLEYIEIDDDDRPPDHRFNYLTPIILCNDCGERFATDPGRGSTGRPTHRDPWLEELNPLFSSCERCVRERFSEAFEQDVLGTIERKLGLTEKDRDALRDFIQTVFTDPKKILKVQELENRVEGLEKQRTFLLWVIGACITLTVVCVGAVIAVAVNVLG